MRILISFFISIIFLTHFSSCSAQSIQTWDGKYELIVTRPGNTKPEVIDTLQISRLPDANPDKLAYQQGLDPRRWQIISVKSKDTISAKPFLYYPQEKYDDYKEFGWTELYLANKINALDAGHIFLVKTTPNTTLTIMGEKYFTHTGTFGVRLHYGIFELRRLEK